MPPQPTSATWILSFGEVAGAGLACAASNCALSPAPAAPRNSRREVTLYFLSEDELDGVDEEELSDDFEEAAGSLLAAELSFELSFEPSLPDELSPDSFFAESPFEADFEPLA